MGKIIRTILTGGVWLLIPLVFVVVVVEKAYEIIKSVATPVGKFLSKGPIAGVAHVEVLTVVIMLLCCLIAGLFVRSSWGKKIRGKIDNVLLNIIPGYAWLIGVIGNFQDEDAEKVLKPVMVRFDDHIQLGFESDRTEEGLVAIYVPDAPDPRSGSVNYVTADRIQRIGSGFVDVVKSYRNLGRGSLGMIPHDGGDG